VRRWQAIAFGALAAASPAVALAAEERSLDAPADLTQVVLVTVLGLLAMAVLGGIGYLYRRERGLDWDFQKPDTPPEGDHH
jgi:hypothetical protein